MINIQNLFVNIYCKLNVNKQLYISLRIQIGFLSCLGQYLPVHGWVVLSNLSNNRAFDIDRMYNFRELLNRDKIINFI